MSAEEEVHAHGDEHEHVHEHDHEHGAGEDTHKPRRQDGFTPKEAKQARRLTWVVSLVGAFFVFEAIASVPAHSSALQTDAIHLLMDVFALGMSLLAMKIAVRRPTPRFTFGLRRAEPVAALFSSMLVLFVTAAIVRRAIDVLRGLEPSTPPDPWIMLPVACGALVVNGISAWMLHDVIGHGHGHPDHKHEGHGHTLNLRGARLHLLGDMFGSVTVLIAAIVVKAGGSSAADPVASFLVAAIIGVSALRLLRDALVVLLEAAPPHLPVNSMRNAINRFPGVAEVHDMHVWTLGAGHDAIVVHIHADGTEPLLVSKLAKHLRNTYHVEYVTVQVEQPHEACDAPPSLFEEETD